jgi:hypothetical protein
VYINDLPSFGIGQPCVHIDITAVGIIFERDNIVEVLIFGMGKEVPYPVFE